MQTQGPGSLNTPSRWMKYLREIGVTGCAGQLAQVASDRGFRTLEELTGLPDSELLRIHSVGRGTLNSLRQVAADRRES